MKDQVKNLSFSLERSMRYHSKRRAFFNFWERFTNFISIVLSSGAIYAFSQNHPKFAITSSLVLTIFSALTLVIGFSEKAREHLEFELSFANLKKRLLLSDKSQKLIDEIRAEINMLDAKESEPLTVLEQICYNEQVIADGLSDDLLTPITWYQRLFAQYFSICPEKMFKK
ncbi:hypothetical protein QJU83_02280 [Pasteurella skyensis]|uniref:hypothetical protein n=1 Tax=Phocoenobacter skyensis TaxID=97481 RepID=UPI00275C5D94|nr:hypothetical protein [Pasteurella skyensis]MDP8176370.1 hypothetical protein [Pasteurella skyensis]MDP8199117.1 hypothetical protein [Pasteurella skyensis]